MNNKIICLDRMKVNYFRPNLLSSFIKYQVNYFTTDSLLKSPEKLKNFVSHFQSFKPLVNSCNLGVLRDLDDYKLKKKVLKDCINDFHTELEHYDVKTLFRVIMYCLEVSDRCKNREFSLRLIQTLISRLQLNKSNLTDKSNSSDSTEDSESTIITPPTSDNSELYDAEVVDGYSSNDSLDVELISDNMDELFKNEEHFIYLMESFLKFNLHDKLADYFEYFYMSINRSITNYSLYHLVRLCGVLGDLYLYTSLDGLKILLQKSIYAIIDQIDKCKLGLSIYSWIQLVKAVNKCNEGYLYKKLVPHITITIQSYSFSNTTNDATGNSTPLRNNVIYSSGEGFNSGMQTRGGMERNVGSEREGYKFIKLNIHLLNTLLYCGFVDNIQLVDLILETVSKYLIHSASPSVNIANTIVGSEYNSDNPFINELLYKKYNNKLFKAPTTPSFTSTSPNYGTNTTSSEVSRREYNLVYFSLIKLLHCNKIAFVRGLKMAEMYLRTVYPSVYSNLSRRNVVLQVAQSLPFENEKEFIKMSNMLNGNRDLVKRYLKGEPAILLEGVYYLITTDGNEKVYLEIFDGSKRPEKLPKLSEFKLNYLKSLGWECVKVIK